MIAYGVYMSNKGLDHRCDIEYKDQDQAYSNYVLLLETRTPLSIFNEGCSYLSKWLLIVCKLQITIQSTELKVKVKFI